MSQLGNLYRSFYFWLDHLPESDKAAISTKWSQLSAEYGERPDDARTAWIGWCEETRGFKRP